MTARLRFAASRALSLGIITHTFLFACSPVTNSPTIAPTSSIPTTRSAIPTEPSPTAEPTPPPPTPTASIQPTQPSGTAEPFEIQVDHTPVALGQTTLREALALFPAYPEGAPRPSGASLQIGDYNLTPATVFTPLTGLYPLYFNEDEVLVLVVDLAAIGEQKSLQDLLTEYPRLTITGEEPNFTEMQVSLTECVTLIALINHSEILDSIGYAYICPSWVPTGFKALDDEVAYRWLDSSSFSCSPDHVCWGAEFVTHYGCDDLYVEISFLDSAGTAVDRTNATEKALGPGAKARLFFEAFQPTGTRARIADVSCY